MLKIIFSTLIFALIWMYEIWKLLINSLNKFEKNNKINLPEIIVDVIWMMYTFASGAKFLEYFVF